MFLMILLEDVVCGAVELHCDVLRIVSDILFNTFISLGYGH